MTDEERDEYMDKNEYSLNMAECEEKRHFWVKYENMEELEEGDQDDGFYINGAVDYIDIKNGSCQGIVYSELLATTHGSFEIILIDGDIGSKRVISNTEHINGYSTSHLIIYTSGKLRANFIDINMISVLCFDESINELVTCPVANNTNIINEYDE